MYMYLARDSEYRDRDLAKGGTYMHLASRPSTSPRARFFMRLAGPLAGTKLGPHGHWARHKISVILAPVMQFQVGQGGQVGRAAAGNGSEREHV